ncbi:hypothetical protein vBSsoS008_078 [Shigella phage vB_SsoS_008]|nr:hypothetical protein vBSsoS008_078 [Shigella phage vB_SsoS_008]
MRPGGGVTPSRKKRQIALTVKTPDLVSGIFVSSKLNDLKESGKANKFLVVRVYSHSNGTSSEIPTLYSKTDGWTEETAVANEKRSAEMYGAESEIEVYEYAALTNESNMWEDA